MYNVAYEILVILLPLVTSPYLSRILGVDGIGTYSYTYNITSFFVLVAMLGVKNYGNRCIAAVRDRDALNATFWEIYSLQLVVSFTVSALYVLYALLLAESTLLAIIWVPYMLSAMLDINWLFFGLERFKITVTRNFIVKLLTFVLIFVLVRNSDDLPKYIALSSIGFFASQAVLWPFLRGTITWSRPSRDAVIRHLKPMLVLFIPVIAISLYTTLDKVFLGILSNMEQVGYFENASKVPNVAITLVTALGTVMLPRMSNLFARGENDKAREYLSKSMWFAVMLSCALAFGIAAATPEFVPLFFGEEFLPAVLTMQLLAFNQPFKAWANVVRTQYLLPLKKDVVYVESVIAGAIVNILLVLLLIPSYGASGSAVATTFAEAVVCIWQTMRVRRELPIRRWLQEGLPYLFFGCIMCGCVRAIAWFVPSTTGGLLIEIAGGALVFSALCLVFLVTTHDENLSFLVSAVKRVVKRGAR